MRHINYCTIASFVAVFTFVTSVSFAQQQQILSTDINSILTENISTTPNNFFEPDCTPPTNVKVVETGDNFILLTWDRGDASSEYRIRYRPADDRSPWKELRESYESSVQIVGVIPRKWEYQIEVAKICRWRDGSEISSEWVAVLSPKGQAITLPPFTCGNTYPYNSITCNDPIMDVDEELDIIYIGGFPVQVEEITNVISGDDGVKWSGNGTIPLPFGQNKSVKVQWTNIKINTDFKVCQGTMKGVPEQPAPNLNPGPIPFGGEICVTPPSQQQFDSSGINTVTGLPWDTRGFGQGAPPKYIKQPPYPGYQPGMPYDTTQTYDPNGFDAYGIHALTGTPFNPQGCDMNGVDSLGNACDPNIPPYSWITPGNSNPQTQAGLEFADEKQDSLTTFLTGILNLLNGNLQDSLEQRESLCNAIRAQMRTLVGSLALDSTYIYGPNNEYFNVGMYENFSQRPVSLQQHYTPAQRNPQMKQLEDKHIDLYDCDKLQADLLLIQQIIADYLGDDFQDLYDLIYDKITRLPESEINKFRNNSAYFMTWLSDQVKLAIQDQLNNSSQSGGGNLVGSDNEKTNSKKPGKTATGKPQDKNATNEATKPAEGTLSETQSSDTPATPVSSQEIATLAREKMVSQYLNGAKTINGVPRAFWLEAIEDGRSINASRSETNETLLPVVVSNIGSDGRTNKVYLDSIVFFVNSPAVMDVHFLLPMPGSQQKVAFEADNVNFTPYGFIGNNIAIQLSTDIFVRLSNSARLQFLAGPKTFIAVNCDGFAGLGIAADVELCRNVVIPFNPATDELLPDPARARGHFETYAPNLGELMVSFTMDPFVITGAEEVKWRIDSVTLDMSETQSPVGTPPPGYETPFANSFGFRPNWKGIYVKNVEVSLPRQFSKANEPVSVGVHNLVIDDMGVSCSVDATNILPLNDGNAGGWAFSVDAFELTVLHNSISKAGFVGKIHVPIMRDKNNATGTFAASDCFDYSALIQPASVYTFSVVQPAGIAYAVDMWKAGTVTINESMIKLEYSNSFKAVARLTGTAVIAANLSDQLNIDIPPIPFQNVEISNIAPYFSPGTWGFPNEVGAKFAGFELSFKDVGMYNTDEGEPSLKFTTQIKITDDSIGLTALGAFDVVGELVDDNGRQRWKYKRFKVNDINISGGFPGVDYVDGTIQFYEQDSIYGYGFRGGIGIKFSFMNGSMQMVSQFGRVNGFKYFMIDGLYCGETGINIGPMALRGIGGGVYYHMNRPTSSFALPACSGAPSIPPEIGASLSGIIYKPDNTKGIGIKLTVAVALIRSERAFNANATLEVLFNEGKGLSNIWLYGNARFMADFDMRAFPSYSKSEAPVMGEASIAANLDLAINFNTGTLDGSFIVYANVANVLVGANNGVVGEALIHFSDEAWYVKIGSPAKRAGMKFIIPGFGELGSAGVYLQVGKNVDPIPPLPADIASLVYGTNLAPRKPMVEQGSGFCFGADLNLGNKDFEFLIFYAGLNIRAGFDISVLDYGPGAVCAGGTDQIGINGWYAEGQIYAAVHAKIGIRVKVFGKRKNFDFVAMSIGAALEAKLPNPFWARGGVGFSYNVLGGLIKGQGNFEFEIGEQCAIVGQDDPYEVLPIIASTNPINNASKVPVTITPEVKFNFPVGEGFAFTELDGANNSYTITLDSVKLLWRNTYRIQTKTEWATDRRSLKLATGYFLPANDTFTLQINVHVDSNGITINSEERIVSFTTGNGLNYIPKVNVAGSYPLDGQFNFYKLELTSGKGYIQLKQGQPDLFSANGEGYDTYVRFRDNHGGCIAIPLPVDEGLYWDKKIEFDLPLTFLENEEMYELQVLDFPRPGGSFGAGTAGTAPCTCNGCTLAAPPSANLLAILATSQSYAPIEESPIPQASPGEGIAEEKILYSAYFRVSEYNTFMDKILALENEINNLKEEDNPIAETTNPTAVNLQFSVPITIEPFDKFEQHGLVSLESYTANNTANNWEKGMYPRYLYPVSGALPALGYKTNNWQSLRDNGATITYPANGLEITKAIFNAGMPPAYSSVTQNIIHSTPKLAMNVFEAARLKADQYLMNPQNRADLESYFLSECPNQMTDICDCIQFLHQSEILPYNPWGIVMLDMLCNLNNTATQAPYTYPVRVVYRLPGTNQVTFSQIFNLKP